MAAFFQGIMQLIKTAPVWLPVAKEILGVVLKFVDRLKEIQDNHERAEAARKISIEMTKTLETKDQRELEKALGNDQPGRPIDVPGSVIERIDP